MVTIKNFARRNLDNYSPSLFVHGYLPKGNYMLIGGFRCVRPDSASDTCVFYFANELDFVANSLQPVDRYDKIRDSRIGRFSSMSYKLEIGYVNDLNESLWLLSKYCKDNGVYIINADVMFHSVKRVNYNIDIENSMIQYNLFIGMKQYVNNKNNREDTDYATRMNISIDDIMNSDRKGKCDYKIMSNGRTNPTLDKIVLKQSLMGSTSELRTFGDKVVYYAGDMVALLPLADYILGPSPVKSLAALSNSEVDKQSIVDIFKSINIRASKVSGVFFKGKENTLTFEDVSVMYGCRFRNMKVVIKKCGVMNTCMFENCTLEIEDIHSIINCGIFKNCKVRIKHVEYELDIDIGGGKLLVHNKPQYLKMRIRSTDAADVNLNFELDKEEFMGARQPDNRCIHLRLDGTDKELDYIRKRTGATVDKY